MLEKIIRLITSTAPDFNVMWLAARDLAINRNPYINPDIFTGVGYPPNTLLFYLPLVWFPYHIAQTIFTLLSFFSIFGSVYLSLRTILNKIPWFAVLAGVSLTLLSFPTKFTLGMGQNNAISLLILILSYYFFTQKKSVWSGIFLGVAVTLKPTFVFFIPFFIFKREWKIVIFSFLAVISSTLLTVALFGADVYEYYIKEVIPPLLNLSGREIYYNQGIMGFVSRLIPDLGWRRYLTGGISLAMVLLVWLFSLKKKNNPLLFSLFFITLLLIDTLSWQHHFIWLIFPFIILMIYSFKARNTYYLLLSVVSYILVSWNFKNPLLFNGFPQVLILSHVFYGTTILFLLNLYLLLRK